jgi:hypothetical protein
LAKKAGTIIVDHAMSCWEEVRPARPKLGKIGVAKGRPV